MKKTDVHGTGTALFRFSSWILVPHCSGPPRAGAWHCPVRCFYPLGLFCFSLFLGFLLAGVFAVLQQPCLCFCRLYAALFVPFPITLLSDSACPQDWALGEPWGWCHQGRNGCRCCGISKTAPRDLTEQPPPAQMG